ncbi:uncharacterized protein VTP21DRAFT_8908 [Calcarisporiella thermophila]|uniref:uncharacterized protein n=1 Tax=Calcarisporiella thermophila TaxID=911321 RepID=UPI00374205EA
MDGEHEGTAAGSSNFHSDGASPNADHGKTRRPRSTMACIRCRKKKVKCDFLQPTCSRCSQAGLPCTYSTPPRRVDGHAFDTLGNHVEQLKARMQKMQNDLMTIKNSLNSMTVPPNPALPDATGKAPDLSILRSNNGEQGTQGVTWKLSLSPSGLRIDTNIASVQDLYKILLQGISQLSIRQENRTGGLLDPDIPTEGLTSRRRREHTSQSGWHPHRSAVGGGDEGTGEQRLWEITPEQEQEILREQQRSTVEQELPSEVLDRLVEHYLSCFVSFQVVNKQGFLEQYRNRSEQPIDPLLLNSIYAWTAKHLALHHHFDDSKDPNIIGEYYFKQSRQLLKKRFDVSNPDTIQALINMFLYQITSSKPTQAYLYIGLAARMAQDLKLHRKETGTAQDAYTSERLKRLWWTAFWLDSHAVLEASRSTMIDDRDCDVDYPAPLADDDPDTVDKIEFGKHMIKLISVRRDVAKQLLSDQSGQSLLSAISMLENALTSWFNGLPSSLQIQLDDPPYVPSDTTRFHETSKLLLNIAYNGSWIYLHKLFLPKSQETSTPIALLSLNICTKSANQITDLVQTMADKVGWCQMYIVLDSIALAAKIHQQAIVLRTEPAITFNAKRNLVRILHMLRDSTFIVLPLIDQLVAGIESFLELHQITDDLRELEKERVDEPLEEQEGRAEFSLPPTGGGNGAESGGVVVDGGMPFFGMGMMATNPMSSSTSTGTFSGTGLGGNRALDVPQTDEYLTNATIGNIMPISVYPGHSPGYGSSPGGASHTFTSPSVVTPGTVQSTPLHIHNLEPQPLTHPVGMQEEFDNLQQPPQVTAPYPNLPGDPLTDEDRGLFAGLDSGQIQRTSEDIDAFLQSIGDELIGSSGEQYSSTGVPSGFPSDFYSDTFAALSRVAMDPQFHPSEVPNSSSSLGGMSSMAMLNPAQSATAPVLNHGLHGLSGVPDIGMGPAGHPMSHPPTMGNIGAHLGGMSSAHPGLMSAGGVPSQSHMPPNNLGRQPVMSSAGAPGGFNPFPSYLSAQSQPPQGQFRQGLFAASMHPSAASIPPHAHPHLHPSMPTRRPPGPMQGMMPASSSEGAMPANAMGEYNLNMFMGSDMYGSGVGMPENSGGEYMGGNMNEMATMLPTSSAGTSRKRARGA